MNRNLLDLDLELESAVASNPRSPMTLTNGTEMRIGSAADIDILLDIDRDACVLFERAGLQLALPNEHEVTLAERGRWLRCLAAESVLIAVDSSGADVGFAALATRDGEPYLDQLSVREKSMRQHIGTALLYAVIKIATDRGGRALWLTTYNHLSWNRPYYERHGFALMSLEQCGEELRAEHSFERRLLPKPQERVIMRKPLATRL